MDVPYVSPFSLNHRLLKSLTNIKDEVYLDEIEGDNSPLFLLINSYFGFHFAFYGVTGTGKTRAVMNLAINSEDKGLCLRILDVEDEWKKIIPKLSMKIMNKKQVKVEDLKSNPYLLLKNINMTLKTSLR